MLVRILKQKALASPQRVSSLSALNLEARWDISIMYSLILPLPVYHIEIRLVKSVPISTFSFLTNLCLICARNSLAVVAFSVIESLNAYGMAFFMIMIHMWFDLSHFSISLLLSEYFYLWAVGENQPLTQGQDPWPRELERFSCHDLKLEPFSIGMELMLVVIFVIDIT